MLPHFPILNLFGHFGHFWSSKRFWTSKTKHLPVTIYYMCYEYLHIEFGIVQINEAFWFGCAWPKAIGIVQAALP